MPCPKKNNRKLRWARAPSPTPEGLRWRAASVMARKVASHGCFRPPNDATFRRSCAPPPTRSTSPSWPTRSTSRACSTSSPTSCCSRGSRADRTRTRSGASSAATDADRSMDALRQAILQALMDSGQLTPEMLKVLRGESTGDAQRDAELERQLAELLDKIVQRLMDEGYLNVVRGAADARRAAADVRARGAWRARRRSRCSSPSPRRASTSSATRRSSTCSAASASRASARTTPSTSPPGIEAEAASKPYEFGDTLNLDVNATLSTALEREGLGVPINLEYEDLQVHQAEYRSSSRDGADARLLALDDPVRRGPLHARQEGGARAHPPDPHPVPRRLACASCCSTTRPKRSRSRGWPTHRSGPITRTPPRA